MQIEGRTTSLLDCYAEMQLILCESTKKSVFLYIMGGGILIVCTYFFDVCQNKARSGYGVIPVSIGFPSGRRTLFHHFLSSHKRLRLQIRLESLCIEKKQRSKKSVSKTPCASVKSVSFF